MISPAAAMRLQNNKLNTSKVGYQGGSGGYIQGKDGKKKYIDDIEQKENIPNEPLNKKQIINNLAIFIQVIEMQRISFLDSIKTAKSIIYKLIEFRKTNKDADKDEQYIDELLKQSCKA